MGWGRLMFTQSLIATVVSWLGILGGVLTVFGHLQGVFSLSEWGCWLASHWQSWMMTFWGDYLGLSHLTSYSALPLVDLPFFLCLAIIAVASRFTPGSEPDVPRSRKLYSLIAGAVLLASWYVAMVYGQRGVEIDIAAFFIVYWLVAFLMLSH